ncbi:MAG: large conductance mechanosensitive channel protein MscL [Clostridia bacterium]|nr:large conductance mechanosensitive channel protein MscL [Clostridia bacterium]
MKEKSKGLMSDYKKFALKGNAIDLAIGMVIGAAFTTIVNTIVSSIITPVISLLTDRIDISSLFVSLDGKEYTSIDAAKEAGAAIITYGELINSVINFLIISVILFIITKYISKAKAKLEALDREAEEIKKATTKVCPYCKSEIHIEATRCAHCTSILEDAKEEAEV